MLCRYVQGFGLTVFGMMLRLDVQDLECRVFGVIWCMAIRCLWLKMFEMRLCLDVQGLRFTVFCHVASR